MATIGELNFGEYSALREFKRRPEFFRSTFVDPNSFGGSKLSNKANFILVGKKGTGKTTYCLHLSEGLQQNGYWTEFLSFNDEITSDDIRGVVSVQHVDLAELVNASNLYGGVSSLYEFREMWKRRVIFSACKHYETRGERNIFTQFVRQNFQNSSLAEGIERGQRLLRLIVPNGIGEIFNDVVPPNRVDQPELRDFNRIALRLLVDLRPRLYFFFDELNLSRISLQSDEFDLRLALVRDIVKACAELNDYGAEADLDIHCVCSLRPEVRDSLIRYDQELSKLIDSSSIGIRWGGRSSNNHPLMEIMRRKAGDADAELYGQDSSTEFFPKTVKGMFGDKSLSLHEYVLNLTWFRPRDIIRLLKSYQSTNGQEIVFFKGDMHRFLKEYSRISAGECMAELSVKYGDAILEAFRRRVKSRYYNDLDEFEGELEILANRVNLNEFISDLYDSGVILNHDHIDNQPVFYASYREDAALDPELRIMIHRGLWDFFHLLAPHKARS